MLKASKIILLLQSKANIVQDGDWYVVKPEEPNELAISAHLSNSMVKLGPPYPSLQLHDGDKSAFLNEVIYWVPFAISTTIGSLSFDISGEGISDSARNSALQNLKKFNRLFWKVQSQGF
jgi:hypothetical protein